MARAQVTSLICNNFGGINRKESSFSDEKITCSDCRNVELYFTGHNSGIGIRTSKGNVSIHDFNEEIIGLFESNQGGEKVVFVYTEDASHGYLYQSSILYGSYTKLNITLDKTGMACATDFVSGYSDYFVFSNGKQVVFLYTDNTKPIKTITQPVLSNKPFYSRFDAEGYLIGTDGSRVTGLGLAVFDNKLWIFNGHTLYYSYTGVPTDFVTMDSTKPEASAGYIELTKPITAIREYLGKLAVFHKDSSCLISQSGDSVIYSVGDESPGGCAGYDSLVFHGTDLYFYDDTKKGVYAFAQIVNGDKTLTQNIADDLQEELMQIVSADVNKIRSLSVVTEDRNEVWFIVPISDTTARTVILIYDYIRGEWLKRYSNRINCIMVHEADLYSGGAKLYKEYTSDTFDGSYIESFYKCSIFNYGTDNTLKITKFPPRLTVDAGETCDFWIEYIRNYDFWKTPKEKQIIGKMSAKILQYDADMCYDDSNIYKVNSSAIVKLPSTTFKALEMNFRTKEPTIEHPSLQGFSIKNIEFSKLKVKQV